MGPVELYSPMRHVGFALCLLGVFVGFLVWVQCALLTGTLASAMFEQSEGPVFWGAFVVAVSPYMYCCVRLTGASVRWWRHAPSKE